MTLHAISTTINYTIHNMDNYTFSKYGTAFVDEKLAYYQANLPTANISLLKKIYSCIDLTTLSNADNSKSVKELVDTVNTHSQSHPDIPNVAGICIYPKFVDVVRENLKADGVSVVSVAGAFPHAQTFTEIKVAEVRLAVEHGANEIDVVINGGDMLAGNYDAALNELRLMREACKQAKLKVILETGVLKSDSLIYNAAIIAMKAGADFVKTSTGKNEPAATPRAVLVMALAVKDFEQNSDKRIGIKPAGGIRTSQDAILYATIVSDILGNDRICNSTFRLGATSLAKNVLSDIASLNA